MPETTQDQLTTVRDKLQFCTFWIDGRLFGVDILDVKEINTQVDCSPVFHASPEVEGYVNIRGQIHLVLDLRLLLGFEAVQVGPDTRVVIFKPSVGETFGVLVDKIGDIVQVTHDQIEERENLMEEHAEKGRQGPLITGECKLEEILLIILNAKRLLHSLDAEPAMA